MNKANYYRDRIAGIACIIVSGVFGWASFQIRAALNKGDPGARVFPLIGCALLLITGVAMVIRRPDDEKASQTFLTREQFIRAASLFGMYILYFLMLWLVGFTAAVPIMLFILCLMFTADKNHPVPIGKRLLRALIYAVVVGGLIYVAYVVLLRSALPKGILWTALGL